MPKIKTLVTHLELCKKTPYFRESLPDNIWFSKMKKIDIQQYRSLYDAVGKNYHWVSRKRLTDSALSSIIHSEFASIYFLFEDDVPIGFFELNSKNNPRSVEISFVGLIESATGKGLGRLITNKAIQTAWQHNPNRIIIQTCTLDNKRALPLYQKLGFTAYDRHVVEFEID